VDPEVLTRLPIALAVIVAATRLTGALFRRLGQPAVIGEIAAGILLGPSLFGAVAPAAASALLPASVMPAIGLLAELGVVLFMFIVGIELDTSAVARGARAAILISQAGIVIPFLMGFTLSWWLYPWLAGSGVSFVVFALFVGVAMSVTAFPVLARILSDFGLQRTALGVIAMSAAAVGDVIAWCLLAGIAGLARAEAGAGLVTTALAVVFAAVMLLVVRPVVARLASVASPSAIAGLVIGMFASAGVTHAIGIHALFGAFLFGALVPAHSPAAEAITIRLRAAIWLLLPTFFAVTGLRTEVRLIDGAAAWLTCLAILAVACAGKFGGSYAAARHAGLAAREAAAIGALMNTRGLVELVVLNLGLSLGVISPTLFAMLVLMALATTAMTTPLLRWLGWRPAT
jgi:Kef-type K+ transport system membrane component KefB